MKYYCTLFDRNYLERGLILYQSIRQRDAECRFFVLAMDDETFSAIEALAMQVFHIDSLVQMGDLKKNHTWQELCWLAASQFMEWIRIPDNAQLTYLDADMMFFSDPQIIFDEIGDNSIGIIPHRFTPQNRARLEKNGRFNVSWVTAKNNAIGRECISLWAKQCRDWCYNRHENGKFGDQKYLNEWPELYNGHVCEISNPGAGLAPWNLPNYRIGSGPTVDGKPVIFYHFHEYRDENLLTYYPLRNEDKTFLYQPYIEEHKKIKRTIESLHLQRVGS